jgi:hypothetical protein
MRPAGENGPLILCLDTSGSMGRKGESCAMVVWEKIITKKWGTSWSWQFSDPMIMTGSVVFLRLYIFLLFFLELGRFVWQHAKKPETTCSSARRCTRDRGQSLGVPWSRLLRLRGLTQVVLPWGLNASAKHSSRNVAATSSRSPRAAWCLGVDS